MLSDEVLEKVVERLTNRIQEANTYVLQQIGKSLREIGELQPSKARQLSQMIKYGADYDKIVKELTKVTKLNKKDIEKIFEEVAKNDYDFAKQFYEYRGKKYIPYSKNKALNNQVKILTNEAQKQYLKLVDTKAIGFTLKDDTFKPLSKAYTEALETAILSVAQGKTTFNTEVYKLIKEMSESGLKTLNYASGRTMRLDSAVRMQMRGALREMHNKTQEVIGKQFQSDGVEISVHLNPAPDHAEVQGKQFSTKRPHKDELSEFEKFQNDQDCHSYDGTSFPAEFEGRDRRSISQYNCYHYTFAIILGVNKPEYSDERLKEIIDENNKGFELDGKHYTNYEGTQLQRQIESEIRKAKDEQIMARAAGIPEDIQTAQKKINALTNKYNELNRTSGLLSRPDKLRVSGYRKIKV